MIDEETKFNGVMKYQENGRFGRITKNMRKKGFENKMKKVLFDSAEFNKLNKSDQTKYVEKVTGRMAKEIGEENTNAVLFECGSQCCGKSWSQFVKNIWNESTCVEDFFVKLNLEEEKYNTYISYNDKENKITVVRKKCICGLINKGDTLSENKLFCNCSIGHMHSFFNTIFDIDKIEFKKSIFNGEEKCEWDIFIKS